MPVARNPQVHRVANIRAELDRVVAPQARPVVDELELTFVLAQRAVAPRELQGIPEIELVSRIATRSVAVEEKRRHPSSEIVEVQAGNPGVSRRIGVTATWIDVDAITKPAEPEVGQQARTERVIEPGRNALIAGPGDSGKRRHFVEAAAARQLAENARRVHAVIREAVAAEHVRVSAEVVVPARVHEILVEPDGPGADVVGLIACGAADVGEWNAAAAGSGPEATGAPSGCGCPGTAALRRRRTARRVEDVHT